MALIIIFIILIVLPIVLCSICFFRMSVLEKRLNNLIALHEEQYQSYGDRNANKVLAANADETDKNSTQNVEKEEKIEQQKLKGKKVYLTFDDGPSSHTEEILDILKKNNIKATFFVIGKTDDFSKKMYQRIYNEGHTLAMHSYSHQYNKIYKSINAYSKDIMELSDLLYDITGERPKYLRFPGGSSNAVSSIDMRKVISFVKKKGWIYYDWNVTNGDATGKKLGVNAMVDNVMSGVDMYETSMVLMHDASDKDTTVKALPKIIKELKKKKANILPIDSTTKVVQHIKAEDVK